MDALIPHRPGHVLASTREMGTSVLSTPQLWMTGRGDDEARGE
jgi:hypothetical protein